jgi:hypothetical protein
MPEFSREIFFRGPKHEKMKYKNNLSIVALSSSPDNILQKKKGC